MAFNKKLTFEGLQYYHSKIKTLFSNTHKNISDEVTRATTAENTLTTNLNSEISRAKSAESTITTNLNNEIARAKASENDLNSKKVDKTTVASSSTLGLVKSGTDITVDTSGNVSVNDNSHKHTVSNISDLTATASELNVLDGIIATTQELNYVDGVISNIQTQLNSKSANGHTHDNRYYTEAEIDTTVSNINDSISSHTGNTSNPHSVTKAQVGLGNVENKSSATIRGEITKSNVTTALGYTPLNQSLKGSASGLAELDSNGKVPSSQLPSFVDDVIEGYLSGGKFYKELAHTTEISGETGKIYIDLSTEKTYRWSGSAFVVISETLALGETSSTAYRGDRGKTAYDHSQSTHARTDATKVEKSSTNGNIKINGTETTVYTHPSGTNPHGTTKSDIGLGNVGNFKAVSTVASQGLTNTEKSNARANIGAGTSSFSDSYNDVSNKPTIPTVGNGTITITQNGTTKGTFTTNQSGNTTIALTDNNTTYGVATQSANGLESAADKKKLDGIATGAEVNQNAFSNVVIGSTTISADSKTDSLTLAGSNVTITPDATNDKVTIGITKDNVISALGYTPGSSVDNNTTYTLSKSGSTIILTGSDGSKTSVTDSDTNTWRPLGTTADTACAGNDSRLSNARPASDVYSWAKASSKPSYSWSEITSKPSTFTPSDHTHSYLPLSGGTVTGNLEVNMNAGGGGGTLTAQKLRVKGDTISGFSRNDMTSTTTLAIKGDFFIYNNMGGRTLLKGSTATNLVYLPSTDGTLTTSAGKSATYTSSLSSGSDTLFTQAGAYAMYSELNSNLAIKLVASNISDNGKITYKPEANTVYLYVNLHFYANSVYIIKVLNSIQFNATRLHGNSEGTVPYETFSFSNGELSIQSYGGHRGYLYKINDTKCS